MKYLANENIPELAFRGGHGDVTGVILLRIRLRSPQLVADTLRALLESGRTWEGFFSVVSETKIRMVPMPKR